MARWFAIILLAAMLTAPHAEEKTPANDCEQEASWKEWQELLAKHPEDPGLQTLHALRIGLCVKIRRGELSVKRVLPISLRESRFLMAYSHPY
jgi:hypothetical protein